MSGGFSMNKNDKKIAIVTLTKDWNYGNRLQNYAVQYVLEERGYKAFTLLNTTYSKYVKEVSLKEIIKYILNYKGKKEDYKTFKVFDNFNRRYINFGEKISKDQDLHYLNRKYSLFITGSDQVWNPNWNFLSGIEYLDFVDDNIKKIALSASFGVESLPKEKTQEVSDYLKRIQFLSVREEEGTEIIRKLSNRTAKVLVDPTMVLPKGVWMEMEKAPKNLQNEEYVLIYVLGSNNDEVYKKVLEYTRCKNIKIYDLSNNRLNKTNPIGPEEFLYLIHHAKYVVTDSFHGSVFSILFETNFYVFRRDNINEDMSSRISTLLSKMHLENRFVSAYDMEFEKVISNDVWQRTEEYLVHEQKSFKEYIQNALESSS